MPRVALGGECEGECWIMTVEDAGLRSCRIWRAWWEFGFCSKHGAGVFKLGRDRI